jgi:NADH-quinone oxidoreductase subunit N
MLKATLTASSQGFWLAIFAILMAAVSVYYYFRVIQAMYFKEGDDKTILASSGVFRTTLLFIAVLVILLGIFPGLLLTWFYF